MGGAPFRLRDAIEAHFPAGPFWYLHIAGVDPTRQGRWDALGVPAYPKNAT